MEKVLFYHWHLLPLIIDDVPNLAVFIFLRYEVNMNLFFSGILLCFFGIPSLITCKQHLVHCAVYYAGM